MKPNRTPIQIYALIVCFAAIVCFVIYLGTATFDIVQIAAPELTFSPPAFSMDYLVKPGTPEYEIAIQNESKRAIRSLIQASIILFIDIGLFIIHWKIANQSSQTPILETAK